MDYIRDGDIIFQPYSSTLVERDEVVRAFQLSQQRVWFRTTRSLELFMGERTVRQFGLDVVVPADPPPLMTIEAYIPDPSMDAYLKGMDCVPSFVHPEIPYREWFELNSLGSLIAVHEVEGSWVLGGMVQDSLQLQFAGEVERLQGEVLRFQLEMPVVEEKYATDVAWLQGEVAQLQAEATQ